MALHFLLSPKKLNSSDVLLSQKKLNSSDVRLRTIAHDKVELLDHIVFVYSIMLPNVFVVNCSHAMSSAYNIYVRLTPLNWNID